VNRFSAAFAAVTLLALPLLAQSPSASGEADSLFNQGQAALAAGDADKAVGYFEKAVAKKPSSSEYHQWLGEAYGTQAQRASMFSQASLAKKTQAELERAVQLDPNNLEARSDLIDYYLMAPGFMGGSGEKAREEANEIRKRDPLAGHRALARIYSHDKQPEQARNEYVAAVREQPASPKAHYALALYYFGEKNWKAAQEEIEATLKIDPAYMPAVFQIGHLAVLTSSNYARGEEALRRYLAYKPQHAEPPLGRAYYWLGGIYEKQGKKAEARQNYAQSLKLIPGAKDVTEAMKRVS